MKIDTDALIPKDAEAAVLGAILLDPNVIVPTAGVVKAADFGTPAFGWVAQAAWGCLDSRTPPTTTAVIERLRAQGRWSDLPRADMICSHDLSNLIAATPDSDTEFAVYHGRIVAQAATRRRGIVAAEETKRLYANQSIPDSELQAKVNAVHASVFDGTSKRPASVAAILASDEERIARIESGEEKSNVVRTGLAWLDQLTGGMAPGMWVVSGPYKGRKTTFYLNIILRGLLAGVPMTIFTAGDSTRRATKNRLVALLMNAIAIQDGWGDYKPVSASVLEHPIKSPVYKDLKLRAQAIVSGFDLALYDAEDGIGRLAETERIILSDKAMRGLRIFVYDFAQNILDGDKDYDKTTKFSAWCQNIIGDRMTAIVVSQVNEEAVKGSYAGNYSAGLKGGGALPAAANALFTLEYDAPTVKVQLKHARDAESMKEPVEHQLVPASGLFLDLNLGATL